MQVIPSAKDYVALLWTGGWDSTFQLLQLLMVERRRIVPFYLIDAERPSTGVELLTMQRIKDRVINEYPHTRELFHPTRYFAVADISPDSQITEAFKSLLTQKFMGSQYDWLARFCKEHGMSDLQLCIHRDDKAHDVLEQFVVECTDSDQTVFRIDPRFHGTREAMLFRYFSFPVFSLSKTEMSAIADSQGWQPIMNMTWFCHRPTSRMTPCGRCNPCRYTIDEGLGWRIPLGSRIRSFFHRSFIQPFKSSAILLLRKLGIRQQLQSLL